MEKHNWEDLEEPLTEVPTELGFVDETYVKLHNESAASESSLTEMRRRLENRLENKRIDLQFSYGDLD